MELPFNPAIPLLGLYPKNPESPIQKNLCTPMFIAVLFTIAKCWKLSKCSSVNEWIKKLWYIYTMEYYRAERKKEEGSGQDGGVGRKASLPCTSKRRITTNLKTINNQNCQKMKLE